MKTSSLLEKFEKFSLSRQSLKQLQAVKGGRNCTAEEVNSDCDYVMDFGDGSHMLDCGSGTEADLCIATVA